MRSAATITGIVWRELVAGLGAALAIGGMDWLSVASHYPLVIIPFATPNNLPWSFLFAPVLAGAMLAPVAAAAAVATTLVVGHRANPSRYHGLAFSVRFCSANWSPSRVNSTLR